MEKLVQLVFQEKRDLRVILDFLVLLVSTEHVDLRDQLVLQDFKESKDNRVQKETLVT